MADTVFHSRSDGISASGVRDQYADGKAAKVWEVFIGDRNSRTKNYRDFLVGLLKEKNCHTVLDIACGTGVDSMMLIDEGFDVTSVDASDKMLKHALKARWNRRKDPKYDNWVIEEANWVSLYEDVKDLMQQKTGGKGYDAVICLGNSFAHLLDQYGDQREQQQAMTNFEKCVRPGGLLLIDHRNFDHITGSGTTPANSIYYNSSHTTDIRTSVLIVGGESRMVTLDYAIDTSSTFKENGQVSEFRLSYYPHKLEKFKAMLRKAFGEKTQIEIYGDFKPLSQIPNPAFYIHIVKKPM